MAPTENTPDRRGVLCPWQNPGGPSSFALINPADYDVVIVGAGPAGLNAAIVLGRCQRRVMVCDHGQPRNYAARHIHAFIGAEGISPKDLRETGRKQAENMA
jgi:threonine dehydrogenase-like Zn-dependent dehydrogenase